MTIYSHSQEFYVTALRLAARAGLASQPSAPGAEALPLGLTARERETLHWITEGKRDREIACILGVSLRTAEHHVASVLQKLSVETRTAAARIGLSLLARANHSDPLQP